MILLVVGRVSLQRLRDDALELESTLQQLDGLNLVADGLVEACGNLDRAMVESRKNGFEWAGPNPQAKTDLLDGLRGFARQVRAASGIQEEPEAETADAGGP